MSTRLPKYSGQASQALIEFALISPVLLLLLAGATWLFIHNFFLIGFRNRFAVLLSWAWSYFTTASFFSKETLTSLTPFTASSADCTVAAQPPQVMPVISKVTVASFAATDGGITAIKSSTPTAPMIVRVFISWDSCARVVQDTISNGNLWMGFHAGWNPASPGSA